MKTNKLKNTTHSHNQYISGLSIIEVLVAIGIFAIIATTAISAILQTFQSTKLTEQESFARDYAREGIEAARSIKNQSWSSVTTGSHGLTNVSSAWAFFGTSNTSGIFNRVVTVEDSQRNGSNHIVDSGGTADTDTKKVTSTVTWNSGPLVNNSITLTQYLTNFIKAIGGDWAPPVFAGTLDLTGTHDAVKVVTEGNYAYLVRGSGTTDFVVVDITNPASPAVLGGLALAGTLNNIAKSGNYIYITSNDNSQELIIINVTTPALPLQVGSYNASGNTNARGIYVSGNYAYLGRVVNGSTNEFDVVNITNPALPTLTGTLNLSGDVNEIVTIGNYAYLASSVDSQEMQVINVTTPATPTLAGGYDSLSTTDALTITGTGSTVFLGAGNLVYSINVSTPTSPSLNSSYDVTALVRDLTIDDTHVLAATSNATSEVTALNQSGLTLSGVYDMSGAHNAFGIAYNSSLDVATVVSSANTQEFFTLTPN